MNAPRVVRERRTWWTYPISNRPGGNPPKSDLVELVPLPVWREARVEEVRRVGEAGRGSVLRTALAHQGLNDIHRPPEEVSSTTQGRGPHRPQKRAFRRDDLQQVVKAVVDDAEGVEDGEQIVADEHLEHGRREIEVDGRLALRAAAREVEDELAVLLLHRAGDGVRTDALAVVVDEVREAGRLRADLPVDEFRYPGAVSGEQLIARRGIDAALSRSAGARGTARPNRTPVERPTMLTWVQTSRSTRKPSSPRCGKRRRGPSGHFGTSPAGENSDRKR